MSDNEAEAKPQSKKAKKIDDDEEEKKKMVSELRIVVDSKLNVHCLCLGDRYKTWGCTCRPLL